jgi:hypothetical protein
MLTMEGQMKGRILGFSGESGSGVISGQDGKRYTFETAEWKSGQPVRAGAQVDFEPNGGTAAGIYPEAGAGIDLSALKGSAGAEKAKQVLTSSLAVPLSIVLLIACAMPALTMPQKSVSLFDLTGVMDVIGMGAAIGDAPGPSAGFRMLLLLRFLAPLMAVFLLWRAWTAEAGKMVTLATGAAAILAFLLVEMVKLGFSQGNEFSQMIGAAIGTGIGTWLILLCGVGLVLTGLGVLGNPFNRAR